MTTKRAYLFKEGSRDQKLLLGGKGANLCEMTNIGLPVPPGFVITTDMCKEYQKEKKLPSGLMADVKKALEEVEKEVGKKFNDEENPLLISVRSGAPVSMPGMMDTVLNLGLNDKTVLGLVEQTGDGKYANDCYRRFIQMFGNVVLGVKHDSFEDALEEVKKSRGVKLDTELDEHALKEVINKYKAIIERETGDPFPTDPIVQLEKSIIAVFESWDIPRAKTYRRINKIPETYGTAVNVQVMAFGNMEGESGTGVGFTRNPSTGENILYGEYLMNAQGEDVVAGIRTPHPIADMKKELPKIYEQLLDVRKVLENHYREMQDFEFTIEKGKLYILQTRDGKRTAAAAVKIAVDMVDEKLINKKEAILRIDPHQIDALLHRQIDPSAKIEVVAKGLPASPGAASGTVVFTADLAEEFGKSGNKVILVRPETTPDDIHGMVEAQGVLTSRGGMTSHAAVVARGMGQPCVAGCEGISINLTEKYFTVDGKKISEGDAITIDGTTGNVMVGDVPTVEPKLTDDFRQLLKWSDEFRKLGVRTNADDPASTQKAFGFGAEGVGLCRTEHMFMADDRLPVVREMILAENRGDREKALDKLLPMQKRDFIGIFKAMKGNPVTIRLIDPPLHEFLPNKEELLVEITKMEALGKGGDELEKKRELLKKVNELNEFNPMLGLRGCRLGIIYPEVFEMQARAIFEAAAEMAKVKEKVQPEIMIPLVGHVNELKITKERVENIGNMVMSEEKVDVPYKIGTMIELPRAALTAGEIAEEAEFFSFGTNDLTQTTFGYSRDDAEGKFLAQYIEMKVLPENPFITLDRDGVGKLVKMAVEAGREKKEKIKLGICGEHGGDPSSVEFCHQIGLDYVSCSPFRVPIARIAAAQAALKEEKKE